MTFGKYTKIYKWTIVKKNPYEYYIIGLLNYKLYISSFVVNFVDVTNNYILVDTLDDKFKLYHDQRFKPTFTNKKAYAWSIHDDDEYLVNTNKISDFAYEGNRITCYRSDSYYDTDKLYTTPITHIIRHSKYIEAFTHSGSNYLLYPEEQYKSESYGSSSSGSSSSGSSSSGSSSSESSSSGSSSSGSSSSDSKYETILYNWKIVNENDMVEFNYDLGTIQLLTKQVMGVDENGSQFQTGKINRIINSRNNIKVYTETDCYNLYFEDQ